MGTDLLRVESNERVDLADFEHAVDTSMQTQHRQLANQFLTNPTKGRQWIIDGFEITNPSGQQVQVTLGRAILGQREGGQVFQGQIASDGEASRIVDVSGYSDATYGIYLRFEYIEGESAGRAFWNPQGSGSEFTQTITTRRIANWSMRIETSTPGAEWFQVGQVIVSAGAISTAAGGLRDMRTFFFEGQRIADIAPVAAPGDIGSQFQSGWSTDGGGVANDRSNDRELYGVKDLQTFTAAMRQCLEDIKGRGLRRWWERSIGGMNIGFDADPTEDVLAVGDADFRMFLTSGGTTPEITWNDADNSSGVRARTRYNRAAQRWDWEVDTDIFLRLDANGLLHELGGLRLFAAGAPIPGAINLGGNIALDDNGGNPSFLLGGFSMVSGAGTVQMNWESGVSRFNYNGIGLEVRIGGTDMAEFLSDGLTVGDSDFKLHWDGTDPFIRFGSNDYIQFDRSAATLGQWLFALNSAAVATLDNTGMFLGTSNTKANFLHLNVGTDEGLRISLASNPATDFFDITINAGGSIDFTVNDGALDFVASSTIGLDSGGNIQLFADNNPGFGTIVGRANISGQGFSIWNDGNNVDREGILIQCGEDTPSGTNVFVRFIDGNGSDAGGINRAGTGTAAFFAASDARLKANINPSRVQALSLLRDLQLFEFRKIRTSLDSPVRENAPLHPIGWIAQQCREIIPEMVKEDAQGSHLVVSDGLLIPYIVKGIQELEQSVNERLAALEAKLANH